MDHPVLPSNPVHTATFPANPLADYPDNNPVAAFLALAFLGLLALLV